jgi:hypothetical protein
MYVKLDKVQGASDLVKVNIVMDEATLRLQITQIKDQRRWPYQIKNLTDKTITFYQKVYQICLFYLIQGRSHMGERIGRRYVKDNT